MKLYLLDRSSLNNNSFLVTNHCYAHFLKVWHYHSELELVLILKSEGTHFIGDNIEHFSKGNVILIGKNLPHMWLNDKAYFKKDSKLEAQAISIHFDEHFAGKTFFEMSEMILIKDLIQKAKHGIKFSGNLALVTKWIKQINKLEGFDKTIKLFTILNLLSKHKNYKLLSSSQFISSFNMTGKRNLENVYEYIIKNFKENITLIDVANVAYMNPSAFSRFFKRVNRKTFKEYLNEVRIGYSCKLLIENKNNISEICYESGFNNISNFNRQFKKAMKYSPTEYIKLHSKNNL